ncbi:MAG TPA: hypothetical protein VEU33_08520 [Archangium sp.]|nr:hypothetical protein [Archangium sp.]
MPPLLRPIVLSLLVALLPGCHADRPSPSAYYSGNVPTEANHWGGFNRGALRDEALDALLDEASRVSTPERKVLYARAQERLDVLMPVVPLWHENSVAAVSRRLQDFEPSAHGRFTPLVRARMVEP